MLTHTDIWRAIDLLAAQNGLTASALARLAGLDPTTFNKSKRSGVDGKPRWPSTESIAKLLGALDVDFTNFAHLCHSETLETDLGGHGKDISLISLTEASALESFDEQGHLQGGKWDIIRFPGLQDKHMFALQIAGNTYAPYLRDGDRVIVAPSANLRRGDRVVVKTSAQNIFVATLAHMSANRVDVNLLTPEARLLQTPLEEINWISRIIWTSQ